MRIMMAHKHDANTEAGLPPPMDLVQKMGELIGTYAQQGKFLDGAGLGASKHRSRLTFRGGACTVQHGPYTGGHELPAATWLLEVTTREEAIGWAERYGKILGDGEIELGKVNEPWDIGLVPVPENPPLHYLLIEKADATTEGRGRSPQQKAALSRLRTEMEKAGVLQRGYQLTSSSQGKRLNFVNHQLGVTDGPFAETKELIGGFSIMEVVSWEEAIELSKEYAAILGGTVEIDMRPLEQADAARDATLGS